LPEPRNPVTTVIGILEPIAMSTAGSVAREHERTRSAIGPLKAADSPEDQWLNRCTRCGASLA
jgi:hypothetical protein